MEIALSTDYGNQSMSALIGPEPVRKRPETVLGSKGIDGAKHTIIEMIGNALDEASEGFGDKVVVTNYGDGSYSVRDYGRGIPLGWNKTAQNTDGTVGDFQWHMVYERMYAGGKYGDEDNQHILKSIPEDVWDNITYDNCIETLQSYGVKYLFSIGLNGLGAYATCASSRYLLVKSIRDGVCSEMKFEAGVHIYDELKVYDTDEPNGTFVRWQPDDRVFTDVNISSTWIDNLVKGFSISSSVTMEYVNGKDTKVYEAGTVKSSMEDLNPDVTYSEDFTKSYENSDVALMLSQVALTEGFAEDIYVNNVVSSGGSPFKAIMDAISTFFSNYGDSIGKKFKYEDYNGEIACAVAIKVNIKSLRGQTKDSIDNQYIYEGLYGIILGLLSSAYTNSSWMKDVLNKVNSRYDQRTELEELAQKNKIVSKTIKHKTLPNKFMPSVSYRSGDAEHTELWLVEGDSAKGGVGHSRDSSFQAVFPLRGKTKNIYKADALKSLTNSGKASNKIAELISILGCGTVLDGSFDIDKLKADKIIVLSDADKDGYHIRMLVFIMLLKYMPQLIYDGHLYMGEAPLYKITHTNGSTDAAWTEHELEEYKEQDPGLHFKYYKGIGEMESDEIDTYCMNPKTRRIRRVEEADTDASMFDTLEFLFGTKVSPRKKKLLVDLMGDESYEETIDSIKMASDIIDDMNIDNDLEEVKVS